MKLRVVWLCLVFLAACAPASPSIPQTPENSRATRDPQSMAPTETLTVAPVQSILPSPSPTQAVTATQPSQVQMCSPLAGIPLSDLAGIAANPFVAPRPGYDDGHHGVDFAFYQYKDRAGIEGLGVEAVFSGKVAAVISDRPPYGNMILLETPLDTLPSSAVAALKPLEHLTPAPPDPRLTCPAQIPAPVKTGPPWSLYLLYAHMEAAPAYHLGDGVACGEQLGTAGNTGMSGNPHLHLEARLGPSGSTFASMSHYNNSATVEEMANYCIWRVSGEFRLFNPLDIVK